MKRGYLIGMANVLQVETAYQGGNAPPDAQSLVPRVVKGLRGQTLDTVRDRLDRSHPELVQGDPRHETRRHGLITITRYKCDRCGTAWEYENDKTNQKAGWSVVGR